MNAVVKSNDRPSLLATMAARYNVEPEKMLSTLKATAFKGQVTNEQMMALLIVANQYSLNPWTKEIYAFPDKSNGIVPVVGVDGWSRIMNDHPQFDGVQFEFGPDDKSGVPTWCECVIYRKDRTQPIRVREFMAEVRRGSAGPWGSHPRRMLRHKAMIQCARVAFGFGGIYDPDEAEGIVKNVTPIADQAPPASRVEAVKRAMRKPVPAPAVIETVDVQTGELLEAAPGADDYLPEFTQGDEVAE